MKTIPIQISNEDYEWLSVQAKQRGMTVAQIIEEMVRDASESAEKETEYLLSDPKMKDRLLKSGKSVKGIPYEVVRKKLGV
jgi:macrodomain Ter protein organizer (MatP/YcbG family)